MVSILKTDLSSNISVIDDISRTVPCSLFLEMINYFKNAHKKGPA
jgi:hypothetical protein